MLSTPPSQTHIAELISTTTLHMIAASILLDENMASRTFFPPLVLGLEIMVASSPWVVLIHAIRAIPSRTLLALGWIKRHVDHSIATVLVWAHTDIGIIERLPP